MVEDNPKFLLSIATIHINSSISNNIFSISTLFSSIWPLDRNLSVWLFEYVAYQPLLFI